MKLKVAYALMAVTCLGLSLAHADEGDENEIQPQPKRETVLEYTSVTVQGERHDKNEQSFGLLQAEEKNSSKYGANVEVTLGTDRFGERRMGRGQLSAKAGSGDTHSTTLRVWDAGYDHAGVGYGGAGSLVIGEKTKLAKIPFAANFYACTGAGDGERRAGLVFCPVGLGVSWERHTLGGRERKHFGSFEAFAEFTSKYLDIYVKGSKTISSDDPRIAGEVGLAAKLNKRVSLTASGSIEYVEIESNEGAFKRKDSAQDVGANAGMRVSF